MPAAQTFPYMYMEITQNSFRLLTSYDYWERTRSKVYPPITYFHQLWGLNFSVSHFSLLTK